MSHFIKLVCADGTHRINPGSIAMICEPRTQGTPVVLSDGTRLLAQEDPDALEQRVNDALRERAG